MMLLLDIGNTSVSWGAHHAGHMETTGQFLHQGVDLETQAHKAWGALPAPEKIVVANVAGSNPADRLSAWTMGKWGLKFETVTVSASAWTFIGPFSRAAMIFTRLESPKTLNNSATCCACRSSSWR